MKLTKWIAVLFLLCAASIYTQQIAFADQHGQHTIEQVLLININTADVDELSELPGVGKKKAEAIVSYRELNGEFESIEELTNVRGIGPKMYEKIAAQIRI